MAADVLQQQLEALYRAHGKDLEQFVRARLGRRADVDDVCQEVWAAVAARLARDAAAPVSRAFIFGIARHKTVDVWRKDGGGFVALDTQITHGGALASLLGVRRAATPTRDLSRQRKTNAVRDALKSLKDDDRELLELRFVHGLKPADIAEMFGAAGGERVEANTISQRIVRATRRLKDALSAAGVDP